MKTVAVVIARKGSTRIPNKWQSIIGKENLIQRKIRQLKICNRVDEIVVGSNDTDMQNCVEALGARFVLREEKFCDEKSSTVNEMVQDMVSKVEGDIILWAHPTNPFIGPMEYDYAMELFDLRHTEYEGYDSVVATATLTGHYINQDEEPINFNWDDEPHRVAADLPFIYKSCGGIFIRERESMLKDGCLYGKTPILYHLSETTAWDLDEPWQLAVARYLNDQ